MFNVRVVSLDHYLSKPIDELYENEGENFVKEWQEPVIRIFGATVEGVKTCVHVHGVYPYICIPYKGGDNPDRDALLLGAALDEALKTSFNSKVVRYVHKVILISGIPLYGYHSKLRKFFKIYFFNPYHIRKASDLLLSGAILGQKFQPHEAHIPYALQFMMDYNIYGMSFATFSRVRYRRDPERRDSFSGVREEDFLSRKVKKITCSRFEVDALASDIMNRVGQKAVVANPGLRAIWEDERDIRRRQNRPSPITVPQSQSRPETKVCPTELMYKDRLAQKLRLIAVEEAEARVGSQEGTHVYPAEVPDSEDILEASAIDEDLERPRVREDVEDVLSLIDERILSEVVERFGRSESEEEEEADSVLGRNQRAEEGAELEDEEGVDMTQPLDSDERDVCGAEGSRDEPGRGSSGSSEEAFWRSMADKIYQLDGAQESSSESDVEAAPSGSTSEERTSDGPLECSSTWSTNIMSILSEDSGCPTPSTICQTPRTFWSNYSPNWLPHDQDDWNWNRNGEPFPDFAAKTAPDGLCDFPTAPKDLSSGEPYVDLFNSSDSQCFPSSAVTLLCGVPSSSPPTGGAPASELGPTVGVGSVGDAPVEEKGSAERGATVHSDRQKFLQVLKNFAGRKVASEEQCCQLTLKQYIKDCKEIVSVDFKNLCNQEMIIIEYKSRNKKSVENKYLIKPLENFLENWKSAERKAKDGVSMGGDGGDEGRNVRSVINVVESKFGDSSRVQSRVSNRLTVKSMEIVPEEGGGRGRCYNVNGNVISQGKIKMKLIKSRRENLEKVEESSKSGEKCRDSVVKRRRGGKEGRREERCKEKRKRGKVGKRTEWKSFSELDSKLINEINSSFEEYFKSLVKRKNLLRKRSENVEEESEVDDDEEEEEDEEEMEEEEEVGGEEQKEDSSEDEKPSPVGKLEVGDVHSSNADPIKFVTRFLSTFSRMPDMPPFSVTISLGNPRTSVPVQVNFQPAGSLPRRKEVKYYSKKRRRKMKVENVDGAADESSSSESGSGESKGKVRGTKRRKKEAYYKPLKVVVYGSPGVKEGGGGRKRKVAEEVDKAKGKNERCESSGERRRGFSSGDGVGVCREKPKLRTLRSGEKSKSSSKSRVKSDDTLSPEVSGQSSEKARSESNQEADFIDDSDEERKRKRRTRRWPKLAGKSALRRIPQADTEAFTSTDDEELKRVSGKFPPEKAKLQGEPAVDAANLSLPSVESKLHSLRSEIFGTSSLCPDSPPNPLSPFTLSGDPLFASNTNSPETSSERAEKEKAASGGSQESCRSSTNVNLWSGSSKLDETESGEKAALDMVLGAKTITPGQRPISRKEAIESMQHYGILESEEDAAFYSDPRDVTKAVEAGPRLLKIENRSVAGLKPFRSSLDVLGTEERRNLLLTGKKAERWQLVGDRVVTIVPLRRPPSGKAVSRWLSRENGKKEGKREKAKVKVMKPLSPGQEEDSGEEMELSVTVSRSLEESCSAGTEEDCLRGDKRSFPEGGETKSSNVKEMKRVSVPQKLEVISEDSPGTVSNRPVPDKASKGSSENSFQIRGVTLDNTFGFSRSVENLQNVKASATHQYMDILVVEVHVLTRRDLQPDPDHDPIRALFYAISFDSPNRSLEKGVIVVGDGLLSNAAVSGLSVHHVATEKALIEKLLAFVREWDPEILAGYEIEMHSWGYLVQRGMVLEMNLLLLLGRVVTDDLSWKNPSNVGSENDDAEDIPRYVRHMKITGRIVLDIWRVLRHEVALTSYSFENVMYHLAHERHPLLSHEKLSQYWDYSGQALKHLVVDHYVTRVLGVIRILDQLDFISRTSELSRLFGIQFYEVLSRGSQFRVESMMLRLAKPLNYIPASPSVAQRAAMRAPASLPLILEPESLFYPDPLIVLDFQSLYPSIIIAYNYCFSTCLGRVEKLGGREPFEFGCTQLQIPPEELKSLENEVNISPAGIVFVKPSVRRGVLPTMLAEILETRLMVKKSMKENKDNKLLQKILFSRQLGLKLIANVTYGYTAANFSGRMPCIEVGDSVVSKGRETLHRAIQLVKNTRKWGARVVYGDTDSIFVLTPGRSREEAFKIGAEIAEAVTQDNPKPVKLKLEKVYQPCILQTKKRYLGYMYESPEQETPVFEAKGIETVRRDGCPAIGKVLEKALRILFDTRDVSLVKKYTLRQFAKLFQGRVNVQDLIFAKEYRGRKGYRPGACVPALHLAKQWTQYDKRAEPRVKERVPYVIVSGPPGVPLIRLVRSPRDLLSDPGLRINAVYYITKALIPPLQRCFSLLGADVMSWYAEMPRKFQKNYKWALGEERKRSTISQYFATRECVVCCRIASGPLCSRCEQEPQVSVVCLAEKIRRWERCHEGVLQICRSCCGRSTEIDCISIDCPVLFRRNQTERSLQQEPALRELLTQYL